jgi:hypothetical protein
MPPNAPVEVETFEPEVLLQVLSDVKSGDFSVRMPLEWTGVAGKIADRLNDVIASNQALEAELARVSRVVGKEGRLSQRVEPRGSDVWAGSVESVNSLIDDLVRPTSEMQRVIGAAGSRPHSCRAADDRRLRRRATPQTGASRLEPGLNPACPPQPSIPSARTRQPHCSKRTARC